MSELIDLSWLQLAIGYLSLIIPILILWYYRTGLLGTLGIAALRMTVQLIFVGIYLEYLFKLDNPWINALWILLMVLVADWATTDRSELKMKAVFLPVFVATFAGIVCIDLFFLEWVIGIDHVLDAQYTIPITGMILGNCLKTNVIGIQTFYYRLRDDRTLYQYYLACGASRTEALQPFIRDALRRAINPTLANIATIGLVSLPGMMTGQILSGSSPMIAVKYQIMIVIAILVGTISTVFLAIWLTNRSVFDEWDQFDESILKN